MTALILTGIVIFLIYNIISLTNFGVPESLSNTYYLFNEKQSGLGNIFTFMMVILASSLLPSWLEITDTIEGWRSNFVFLAFLSASGILFVGSAPQFKDSKLERKVHESGAIIAAVSALAWDFIVCTELSLMIVPTVAISFGILSWITRTYKSSIIYWLEMVAFLSTFLVLFLFNVL